MPDAIQTIALDALRRAIIKRGLRCALLKDSQAWQALYDQWRDACTRAWSDQMRDAITTALDTLSDISPDTPTDDAVNTIMSALETDIGGDAMESVLRGPALDFTDAAMRLGYQEAGAATGVDIAFGRPDLDALRVVQDSNLFWVGNNWNSNTKQIFQDALTALYQEGLSRDELAAKLAEDFAGLGERCISYWTMLADHIGTKTREIGRVNAYQRAGVEEVVVRAHMDDRTTNICRAMNGKVISVNELAKQRDDYLEAVSHRNVPAAKRAWKMRADSEDFSEIESMPEGTLVTDIGGPPYHFNCRTITVVRFRQGA